MSADSRRSRTSRPRSPTSRTTSIIRAVAELSPAVMARLAAVERPPPRPRWVPVAIAAAVLVVVLLAFPAPREAVADWLGIGTVRVIRTDAGPRRHRLRTSGSARRSPWTRPAARAPFTDPRSHRASGPPSAIYAGEPSSDSVTLLWGPGERRAGGGGTRRRRAAHRDARYHRSHADREAPGTGHDPRDRRRSADEAAYWIAGGQHELQYLDPDGQDAPGHDAPGGQHAAVGGRRRDVPPRVGAGSRTPRSTWRGDLEPLP